MKERPILFSGDMVRAILAATKTQTRRIAKPRKKPSLLDGTWSDSYVLDPGNSEWLMRDCPFGDVGDWLWVKETYAPLTLGFAYRADGIFNESPAGKWSPSIFMPRAASRVTLKITSIRVERLQDISEEDARAEGCFSSGWHPSYRDPDNSSCAESSSAKDNFYELWESINGAGSWDLNPFCWVIEFKRIAP